MYAVDTQTDDILVKEGTFYQHNKLLNILFAKGITDHHEVQQSDYGIQG